MKNEIATITDLFTGFAPPDAEAKAAVELGFILLLDPSAATDLVSTIFAGETLDASNWSGVQRILKKFYAHGVIEDVRGENSKINRYRFRAGPLVEMLKRMPSRNTETGLTKTFAANAAASSAKARRDDYPSLGRQSP